MLMTSILVFALTACGKKGVLYYPDMLLPAAPASNSVSQFGSAVKIQFVLPNKDLTGHKLVDLAGVKINKRESDSQEEQICKSCMTGYQLFRRLYLDLLSDDAQRYGDRIVVLDGNVTAGKTYSYNVVPFTKDDADGAASSHMSVRFVQPVPPPTINVESFPTEIRISFAGQQTDAKGFAGYNIYRVTQQNVPSYLPINRAPLTGKDYIDSGLDRNRIYRYTARTVIRLESGGIIESSVSNVVDGMLKNDE